MMVVIHRRKLPKEVVDVSCLETFLTRSEEVVNNLLKILILMMFLLIAGELDKMAFKGSF